MTLLRKKKYSAIYEKILNQLKELKALASQNKAKDCLIIIGGLSIYFAENRDISTEGFIASFIELQSMFQDSVYTLKFFKFNILRDRKNLTSKIDRMIEFLQTTIA